jgi:hypothetical protein
MEPIGSTAGFNSTDAFGNPITPAITNQIVNFGWEYVWHCHILSHEEMDMMRPISVGVSRVLPAPPTVTYSRNATTGVVSLTWTDGTAVSYGNLATWGSPANEVGFRIERATVANNGKVGTYSVIGSVFPNVTSYTDSTAVLGTNYNYRVVAYNAAGNSTSATVGAAVVPMPSAPTNLVAALQSGPKISLTWRDNANNESYFVVEKSVDGGAFTLLAQPAARNNTGNVTYVDTVVSASHSYRYRVAAVNAGGQSAYATSNTISTPSIPLAPSNLAGTAVQSGKKANITLTWKDNSNNETGFIIERATNPAFTVGLNSSTVAANTVTVTQTGLYRGVTYYYRVRAANLGGVSAWSNVFSIVTP